MSKQGEVEAGEKPKAGQSNDSDSSSSGVPLVCDIN